MALLQTRWCSAQLSFFRLRLRNRSRSTPCSSLGWCSDGALVAPLRPVALLLSADSLADSTSRTSTLLLAQSTGSMVPLLSGRWSWSTLLVYLQVPDRPSLGSCSGSAVLALVQPVVPYTLVLSSSLSTGDGSGSALYNALLANGLPPKLPTAGRLLVLTKALLSFSDLKYSRKS